MPHPHVFATSHLEHGVPLAAVLAKCHVAVGTAAPPEQQRAAGHGGSCQDDSCEAFCCMCQYDHVARILGVLQPLPAVGAPAS